MINKTIKIILFVLSTILTVYFIHNNQINYAIISGTLLIALIILYFYYLINNRTPKAKYNSLIYDIITKYDSILVECDNLPSIKDKNIILISSIEELIDAQYEMRKSIYYKMFDNYTVFILIDNEEACITTIKEKDNIKAQYEEEIKKYIKKDEEEIEILTI